MTLPKDADAFVMEQLEQNAFQILPVQLHHALGVAALPGLHPDPFDRLLIAQARSEELAFLSRDRRLADYSVRVLW